MILATRERRQQSPARRGAASGQTAGKPVPDLDVPRGGLSLRTGGPIYRAGQKEKAVLG